MKMAVTPIRPPRRASHLSEWPYNINSPQRFAHVVASPLQTFKKDTSPALKVVQRHNWRSLSVVIENVFNSGADENTPPGFTHQVS